MNNTGIKQKKERKFKINQNYQAIFTFPTAWDQNGNITRSTSISTEFKGININKFGLKKLIYKKATDLSLPRGYTCKVIEDVVA